MPEARGTRPEARDGLPVPSLEPTTDKAVRREFQRRVMRASLIVDGVILLTLVVVLVAWKLRTVLLLIVVSLFLTLLLHPVVSALERRGVRRGLATGIVFVSGLVIVATLLFVILRPLVNSAEHLANELPHFLAQAEKGRGWFGHFVKKYHLIKYVSNKNGGAQSLISHFSKPALSIGKGVLSGVVKGGRRGQRGGRVHERVLRERTVRQGGVADHPLPRREAG
ncbi:MAG: AI-2E family transporter, partial [Acidimicrobiales bacterium]